MNITWIAAEGWRLAGMIRHDFDNPFPVMHLKNAPSSTSENYRHVYRERSIDGDRAESLRSVNDSIFLRCLKDRIETVVLDDTLALTTEQQRAIGCLFD